MCIRDSQQGLKLGKKLGVYHFAGKNGASQEAEYFVNNIKGYIGKALLALDWEGSGAVSYTHLDVYKRQSLMCRLIR